LRSHKSGLYWAVLYWGASDLQALAVAAGSSLANDNLFSGVFFFPPKSWFLWLLFVYELYSATTSIKCNISFSLCNPFLLKDYQSRNLHH
jgi:hypothetical protein